MGKILRSHTRKHNIGVINKMKAKKGMGFKAAANSVAKKEGIPVKRAQAIIAASTRKASPEAKKANPNLKKVKGK